MNNRQWTARLILWTAIAGMLWATPAVLLQQGFAQNEPAAPAAENAAAPAAEGATDEPAQAVEVAPGKSMWDLILQSGLTGLAFMIVLALFSIVAATIAIERAVNTTRKSIIPTQFVSDLRALVRNDNATRESLHVLCDSHDAPVADVLRAGLLRAGRPLPEVEKSMEDAAAREMAGIRGRIRPLSVIGSIAPLVGLLGTVLGMIVAFRTASEAGLGKGELMAQGIYMALLTTAAGLTIAIPCLLLAAMYNSKVEKLFREIDENLIETMPGFARMESLPAMQPAVEASREPVTPPAPEPAPAAATT